MTTHLVKTIIPIYRAQLHPEEQAALQNNLALLDGIPAAFIKPESLDISELTRQYPQVEVINVSDNWLGSELGVRGYYDMMTSARFYELFADCDYIFICHVDAWLFRNEVEQWCRKGYDLVAAHWPTRPRYKRFPLKQYIQLKIRLKPAWKNLHCQMFGKIGNGGLCLRKVETFRNHCLRYAGEIERYKQMGLTSPMYNEDIFWAFVPSLRVPTIEEVLTFAFDLKPTLSYKLYRNRLPMGCHGFNKNSRIPFWSRFIPCIQSVQ